MHGIGQKHRKTIAVTLFFTFFLNGGEMQHKMCYLSYLFKWPTCVSFSAKCMKQCPRFLRSWMFIEEVFWRILT